MNRVPMNHPLAMALTLGAALVLAILAALNQVCQLPTGEMLRSPADVSVSGGKSNDASAHCLIFGKYCLGDSMRGKQ
jgi:hypothetical protein